MTRVESRNTKVDELLEYSTDSNAGGQRAFWIIQLAAKILTTSLADPRS